MRYWAGRFFADAHWRTGHWLEGAAVVGAPVQAPSLPSIRARPTIAFPIRYPRVRLEAGAAEVMVEAPPARLTIGAGVPVRLRAGSARLQAGARAGRLVIGLTRAPRRLQAAPGAVLVGISGATLTVVPAGDEMLALALLGLL